MNNEIEFASKIIFRDPEGRTATVLGRIIESKDPDFLVFLSGSGRRYEIRRCLILTVETTQQEFQLRKRPMPAEKEVQHG